MDEEIDEKILVEEAEEKKKNKWRIIYVAIFGGIPVFRRSTRKIPTFLD